MRLSKRGRRRLAVVIVAVLALAGSIGAFQFVRQLQQQRLTAEARTAGLEAYRRGEVEDALHRLSYYLEHRKDDLEANLVFAEARARVPTPGGRHLVEAIGYNNHALTLLDEQPANDETRSQRRTVLKRLLTLYAQVGDRQRLEEAADALLLIEPEMIDALAAKAEVLYLDRRFDEAGEAAERLIELEPDRLTWRRMMLEVRARQGATHDMLVQQCRDWAAAYQGDARFRLLAAGMLVDTGRSEEARAELQSVVALGATSQPVLEQLVALLDMLGMREEADAAIDATLQRFANETWVREVTIRRLWQDGRTDEALEEIRQARSQLPQWPSALARLEVAALLAADRVDDARAALQPLLESSAADIERDADRAWALAISNTVAAKPPGWAATVQSIQQALTLSPKDPVLHFLLGQHYLAAGEHPGAIAAYRQAWSLAPNWIAAGMALGESLRSAGRLDEAFRVSQVVLSRAGSDRVDPFLLLTRCLLDLREAGIVPGGTGEADLMPEVMTALRGLYGQAADVPGIALLMLRACLIAGDNTAASDVMHQAVESTDPDAGLLLAMAEISVRHDLGRERALLDRAREVAGDSLPVIVAEARLLARANKPDEGQQLLDDAISGIVDRGQREEALINRAAFMIEANRPNAIAALSELAGACSDSVSAQQYVLSQPLAWNDQTLIARSMDNLRRLLGDSSLQVRLAEANFLLRHHSTDPAMLARAVATLNRVLEEAPDSLAALSLSAEAMLMGESPSLDRATSHLERAVNLYPGEPTLLMRLISLLQRQGRFDAARRHLQTLSQSLRGDPQLAFEELRLLRAQGDFETALVRAAAMVTEQSPPPQQLLLAAMEERVGGAERAEQIYLRLLESHPNDPMVLAQTAEFFASTGRFDRGLALIERLARTRSPDDAGTGPEREVLIGSFHQRHGRVREAAQWLQQAVANHPDSVEARSELARHHLAAGDRSKARDQALAGLRLDGNHVGLRATLAIANLGLQQGDRSEAITLLRELGQGNDALLAMLELLQRVPMQDGRSQPTAADLAAARQLTEQHALFLPVWQLAIALHVEAGRLNEAIAIARTAVGRLPGEIEPAHWATQLLIDAARWEEALVEAEEWRRRAMTDPIAPDCAIARSLLALGRAGEAAQRVRAHVDRIVAERQVHPQRLAILVEALVRSNDAPAARSVIEPLLSESRQWRGLWADAAAMLPPPDAEAALIALEPVAENAFERVVIARGWLELALRTGQQAQLDRAAALAQGAVDDAQAAAPALIVLGAAAEARGQWEQAEQHYRTALRSAPQNAVVLNNLAFILVAHRQKAGEALPLIEQALKIQPDQPDFLDTYGAVLLAIDRPADAEKALRRALEIRPDDASFMLALAEAHLEQGQRNDAAALLDRLGRRSGLTAAQQQRLLNLRQRLGAAENSAAAASPRPG